MSLSLRLLRLALLLNLLSAITAYAGDRECAQEEIFDVREVRVAPDGSIEGKELIDRSATVTLYLWGLDFPPPGTPGVILQ